MSETRRFDRSGCWVCLCVLALSLAIAPRAVAADEDEMELRSGGETIRDRDDRVPTGARRAAEWEPSREGVVGEPWHFSASAGLAFFTGDDAVADQPGFAFELRAAHDLAGDFYFVGSYLLGVATTEVTDPLDGTEDSDTHVLHVPTVGVGFRAELTPEIHLFVEPKIGALISSDDAGPVGGASAGVDIELDPGIAVRAGVTGLFTDTTLDTAAGDADLSGIWSVGVGLVFRF